MLRRHRLAADCGCGAWTPRGSCSIATPDFVLWFDRRGVVVDRNPAADALADVVDLVPEVALDVARIARGAWSGEVQVLAPRRAHARRVGGRRRRRRRCSSSCCATSPTSKEQEDCCGGWRERDSLTGLRNRHVLLSHLEQAVAGADAAVARARCSTSISITSSRSTTAAVTPRATGTSRSSPPRCERRCRTEDVVARDRRRRVRRAACAMSPADAAVSRSPRRCATGSAAGGDVPASASPSSTAPLRRPTSWCRPIRACYAAKADGGNRVELST